MTVGLELPELDGRWGVISEYMTEGVTCTVLQSVGKTIVQQ